MMAFPQKRGESNNRIAAHERRIEEIRLVLKVGRGLSANSGLLASRRLRSVTQSKVPGTDPKVVKAERKELKKKVCFAFDVCHAACGRAAQKSVSTTDQRRKGNDIRSIHDVHSGERVRSGMF